MVKKKTKPAKKIVKTKQKQKVKRKIKPVLIDFEREEKEESVEIKNALEEISEILEPCIKCGMCKSLCPVFKIIRQEEVSPRGKSILLNEKIIDELVFQCTMCKACEKKCPLKIKVWEAIRKAREVSNLRGNELDSNKEMIKNIRETGNPFGKNPDSSGKLYCC